MRRSFGFEVLACPRCGGRLRLVALIERASVVHRILRHLGLPTEGFGWQELWWDDLLLNIFRMTDNRRDVLSVYTLLRTAPSELKKPIQAHIDAIKKATAFTRDARHQSIAHRNLNVAMGVSAVTLGSRNDVRAAMKSIDDLLHFVEHYFLKTEPVRYEYLENLWGVDSLLDIIDRGLRDRDKQFGYHRHPHPADSG
jgi:hypothetical protein